MILNVSDSFIGLTIIALGTSLPEIATSVTAKKGNLTLSLEILLGQTYITFAYSWFTSLFNSFIQQKNSIR